MMQILVSFCNLRAPGLPALGLFDVTESQFRILRLPRGWDRCCGITGLAISESHVYAVAQASTAGQDVASPRASTFLVFDRNNFSLLSEYPFRCGKDVHSLWACGNSIYAVSTGTDEVIELQLQGERVISETVLWRPQPGWPREDLHHLNALYVWKGELLVSAFGKKTAENWNSARDGFIVNITRREKFAAILDQPHSLADLGNGLAYCESRKMAVRVIDDPRVQYLPGYTRGICVVEGRLFVATSVGRQLSKSTGRINNPAAGGVLGGKCTISRLSTFTFDVEQTIDLTVQASEIYDLIPVQDTIHWPLCDETNWRNTSILELADRLDQRTNWARQSTAVVARRDATISELEARLRSPHSAEREVAELRKTIERQSDDIDKLKSTVSFWDRTAQWVIERCAPDIRQQLVYLQQVAQVQQTVEASVPTGATVVVVSKGDEELLHLGQRVAWHFPQTLEGTYAGANPATSLAAIAQLEALRVKGADFLLLPSTAFWWLDHYALLKDHLDSRYRRLLQDSACIIFDLRQYIASSRSESEPTIEEIIGQCASRLVHEPAILDWNTKLELAEALPQHAVFSPPTADPTLPYHDQSVEVVVVPQDPASMDEARRVASAAVLIVSGPGNGGSGRPSVRVEWQTDAQPQSPALVSIMVSECSDKAGTERLITAVQWSLPREFEGEIICLNPPSCDEGANGHAPRRSFAAAGNHSASNAKGDVLVFIGRAIPLNGWLPPLLESIRSGERIVGSKVLSAAGQLDQAGGVIFSDGSLTGFGNGDYQLEDSLYGYVRDADYSGDTVLTTTRALFEEIGGFNPAFHTSAYTIADYCLQARERGCRTCYQPESVLATLPENNGSALAQTGALADAASDRDLFANKWRHVLKKQPFPIYWRDRDAWHALAARGRIDGEVGQ